MEHDPGGRNQDYAAAARRMLVEQGLVHVVGCYTSSSRKEVLPLFEKHDGLLWYPSHYEGFESSDNVVYTGAAPNQHIVPLAEHLLRHYGTSAYCLGSNYIWAWENNKIMREAVLSAGGSVLAERYVPVGELDLDGIVRQILDCRPSFIFNTLIGDSGLRLLPGHPPCRRRARHRPEPHHAGGELQPRRARAGRDRCRGGGRASEFERLFRQHRQAGQPRLRPGLPYPLPGCWPHLGRCGVVLSRRAPAGPRCPARGHRRDDRRCGRHCRTSPIDAPQGQVRIDRDNRHCYLTPRIGMSNAEFGFDVIYEAPAPVKPDPYLVWQDLACRLAAAAAGEPAPGGAVMSRPIQNFRGRHALVIHPADQNRLVLETTLARLGLGVTAIDPLAGQTFDRQRRPGRPHLSRRRQLRQLRSACASRATSRWWR